MLKLLKFAAVWCSPCKTFTPIVKEVANNQNITLEEIDVEQNEELVNKYSVRSVPTIILVDDDVEIARHVGLLPRTKFSDWVTDNKKKKAKK